MAGPGIGEFMPELIAETAWSPDFHLRTMAGRYVVLTFIGSAGHPATAQLVAKVRACAQPFDDNRASLFIVTNDPEDIAENRLADRLPGIRVLRDFRGTIAHQCRMLNGPAVRVGSFILDPMLRIITWLPVADPTEHLADIIAVIASQPPIFGHGISAAPMPVPILVAPRIFEPELCRSLIAYYDLHGGEDSGVMKDDSGRTVGVLDYGFKRRQDRLVEDEALRAAVRVRLNQRLKPAIMRAFQFEATHIERHMVVCYDSAVGGYFLPHTDNGTKGTAHRRFAVSIHLNSEEYQGGEVRFPEFGHQTYRAPTGGAVVFAASILHEVTPVTSGRRLIFLTFIYNDADEAVRKQNACFVGEDA